MSSALFDCFVTGCLEEAAVAPNEVVEARGEMGDRVVGLGGVDDDEQGSHIDGPRGTLGVGPSGDTGEDIEHVEA